MMMCKLGTTLAILLALVLLISPAGAGSRFRRAPDDTTVEPSVTTTSTDTETTSTSTVVGPTATIEDADPSTPETSSTTAEASTTASTEASTTGSTSAATEAPTTTTAASSTSEASTSAASTTQASTSAAASTSTETPTSTSTSASTASTTTAAATTTAATSPSTTSTETTTVTGTGTSTSGSSTATSTTTPPEGLTRGPTNITCNVKTMFAKPNDTVTLVCTVYINQAYTQWSEWMLEVFFRSTEFRYENVDSEAARVAGFPGLSNPLNSYPARTELIFSATRDAKGETWIDQSDTRGKYSLRTQTDKNRFSLTISDLGFGDDGIFELVLRDKMHFPMVTDRVSLNLYKRPDTLDVVAPPTAVGSPYKATCTVRDFFPPHSVAIGWMVDGKPIAPSDKLYPQSTFWWLEYPKGVTAVSALTLWEAKEASPPPKIKCVAEWFVENVSKTCNATVTPKMYRPPEMGIRFRDGYAICDVSCQPKGTYVVWYINGEQQPASSVTTETVRVCTKDPSRNDIRSIISVQDSWGKSKYTCRLTGSPLDGLPPSEVSKIMDGTPVSRGKPIIALLVVVFAVAMVLGLIVLSVALCFYKASTGRRYRRLSD